MNSRYASLRQGLVGAWCPSLGASGYRLIDRSGYGNHGTLTNMDSGTDWVPSGGKLALDFDGVDDNVRISKNLLENNSQTVTAWIYPRAFTNAYNTVICKDEGDPPTDQRYWTLLVKSNAKLACYVSTAQNGTSVNYDGTGSFTLLANTWCFLCMSYSASDGLRGFVNGVQDNFVSPNGNPTTGSTFVNIGSHDGALSGGLSGRYFNAIFADVRIYNRALTPSEIILLYTGGRGVGLAPERIKHRRQATASITGDLSKTLASLTASSSGSVTAGNSGSLSLVLGSLTSSSSGTVENGPSGSVSQTLGSLSLSSQGTLADGASGNLSKTLDAATLSSGGTVANGPSGSLSSTLEAATLSASGTVAAGVSGSLSATLGDVTLSSTGNVGSGTFGSVSQTLADATLSSEGSVAAGVSGSVSQTLAAATLSSEGSVASGVSGSVSAQLGSLTCTSAGFVTAGLNGAVDAALGSLSLASSGSVAAGNTGSATVQLASAVLSASGTVVTPGVGATLHVRVNGVWKATTPYVKVNGVWKQATAYTKVNGVWK